MRMLDLTESDWILLDLTGLHWIALDPPGFAQLIHSPSKWVVEPMQVKTRPNDNPFFVPSIGSIAYFGWWQSMLCQIDNPCCFRLTIHVVTDWHAQQELQHQRRSGVAALFFAQNGRSHPNKTISTQPLAKCHSENRFPQVLNNMTNLKSGLSPLIECPCRCLIRSWSLIWMRIGITFYCHSDRIKKTTDLSSSILTTGRSL